MNTRFLAEKIFLGAVESVLPENIMRGRIVIRESTLHISGRPIPLDTIGCIYVIGAGKASARMALEIENVLGKKITSGHVVVKYGHGCNLKYIDLSEAGHPVPDNNGYIATLKILDIAMRASKNDLVICLISGGGSALLTDLPKGCTIDDVILANDLLLKSGATITEINTVRKHWSKIKGGGLAKAVYPATLITLILSDVIGDSLDAIASGPTVPDSTTFEDAQKIIEKYKLVSQIPQTLMDYLEKGSKGFYKETPKAGDLIFKYTQNIIVGSNKTALKAAAQKAMELGLYSRILATELQGDSAEVAKTLIKTALIFQIDNNIKKPYCLLYGGETTIKVKGKGTGGRNQHMALHAALLLKNKKGITLLAAGTDGSDGPTPAAGAVVDAETFERSSAMGLGIKNYLENFDAFHFFEKAGGHIITGPTRTNVMDIIVIVIE